MRINRAGCYTVEVKDPEGKTVLLLEGDWERVIQPLVETCNLSIVGVARDLRARPKQIPHHHQHLIAANSSSSVIEHPEKQVTIMTREFEALARELHASDVFIGMQSTSHGILSWITGYFGRCRKDHVIAIDPESGAWPTVTAAQWAHGSALKLFPDSTYARRYVAARKGDLRFKAPAAG